MTLKQWLLRLAFIGAGLVLLGALATLIINLIVCRSTASRNVSVEDALSFTDADCILVLGCGVHADGSPTHMLEDRLKRGIELYKAGAAPKLLMSGDHGRTDYNEVATMKAYAIEAGVPSEDIFMDHAGFSTYESIVRAKQIFQADKLVIVTQDYHLYRALYIAKRFDVDAIGVNADLRPYAGQLMRDIREVAARVKDTFTCIFKPAPTYLGDAIPVSGNGNVTND